jgi:hypothetical protein
MSRNCQIEKAIELNICFHGNGNNQSISFGKFFLVLTKDPFCLPKFGEISMFCGYTIIYDKENGI